MALSTQPYKGARDFYPEDKRLQKYMFGKLREVAEKFGYEEYDAPILEPLDIYLAKSGEEIVNEQTYVFEDRGGRKVVIRPEMTPTVSRMVAAKRQQLIYPLRWYSIPNLWRYERPQRGRLREHWQLNVDIFGVQNSQAEIEVITLVDDVFKKFGADESMYTIKINDRKFVNHAMKDFLKLSDDESHTISKLIDKMHKMERNDFIKKVDDALNDDAKKSQVTEKLLAILDAKEIKDLPSELKESCDFNDLESVLVSLKSSGINNVVFDPTLMRGFDYYTDIVFEVFDNHPENNRAMLGGGRYDGLVGLFGVEPVPTVGFGWGDVTLANFLELHNLMPQLKPETDAYVSVIGESKTDANQIVAELRKKGIKLAVDLSDRKLGDQMKSAEKKGLDQIIIIGDEEISSSKITLKNLKSGDEQKLDIDQIADQLKSIDS